MGGESEVGIHRQSSIENEPRTLNIRQIHYAREAALYVVSTRSMDEALSIFTEGLEPVASVARGNENADQGDEPEPVVRRLKLPGLREIASAPF